MCDEITYPFLNSNGRLKYSINIVCLFRETYVTPGIAWKLRDSFYNVAVGEKDGESSGSYRQSPGLVWFGIKGNRQGRVGSRAHAHIGGRDKISSRFPDKGKWKYQWPLFLTWINFNLSMKK